MPPAGFEPAIAASEWSPRSACMSIQWSAGVFVPVACTEFCEVSNRTNRAANNDVCQLIQEWSTILCLLVSVVRMAAIVPTVWQQCMHSSLLVQDTGNLLKCKAVTIFGTFWVQISALRPTVLMHFQFILRFENCTGFCDVVFCTVADRWTCWRIKEVGVFRRENGIL
jgi:hypothetical protein